MTGNNKIGHVENGSSDKVYIVSIIDNRDGTFDAVGRYGRRDGNIKEAKLATRVTRGQAERAADEQIRKKFHKSRDPYVCIDSSEYRGNLTRQDRWLRRQIEPEAGQAVPAPVKPQAPIDPNEPATRPGSKLAGSPKVQAKREAAEAKRAEKARLTALKKKAGQSEELICVDNAGYDHLFDLGVEYIVTNTKDTDFYDVIDKYGDSQTMYRERFATEEVARGRGLLNEALA